MIKAFRQWSLLAGLFFTALCLNACSSDSTQCEVIQEESLTHKEYGVIDHDIVVESHDVVVYQRSSEKAVIGQGFPVCLTVAANCSAANVIVTSTIAEDNASFIKAEPDAKVDGNQVTWTFPFMRQGDCRDMTLWVMPKGQGDLVVCTTLQVHPVGCICVNCGCPVLTISKCGPEKVLLGDQVCYEICVSNEGNHPAEDVCLKDHVPEGLCHRTAKDVIAYRIGTLCPGESRSIPLSFEAVKEGEWCNKATIQACNCPTVSAEACTNIVCHRIAVSKTGPKTQYIGKTAKYNITVSNPGSDTITGVCVTDTAPCETCISDAPGAAIANNRASWDVGELAPGEGKSFEISLCCDCCGCTVNRVDAQCCEGCCDSAEFSTEWKGHSALLIEVVDCEDPLMVGCETQWRIRVTNQGTAADKDVRIIAHFPEGLSPKSADGSTRGAIDGQTVNFAAVETLDCQECCEWWVTAEAMGEGDHRVRVEMLSSTLHKPVVEEESTFVY